jgi:adenylosuccinate synthase
MVVISGPLCAGKTTLAVGLGEKLPAPVLKARTVIERSGGEHSRIELQVVGEELERSTGGRWLADAAVAIAAEHLVIDSARTAAQIAALRDAADSVVIYLTAAKAERRRRFNLRRDAVDASADFDRVLLGEPSGVPALAEQADLVLETDTMAMEEIQREALTKIAEQFL